MTTSLDLTQDATHPWRIVRGGVLFPGEVAVATAWRGELRSALPSGSHFRVVLLRTALQRQPESLVPGVVVASPVPTTSPELSETQRQLGVLREVQAGYRTSGGTEFRALGQTLAQEEQQAASRVNTALARSFAGGTLATASTLDTDSPSVFQGGVPADWASALALSVLRSTLPEPPTEPRALARPVAPEDVTLLLNALTASRPDAAAEQVARDLLPGLRLTLRNLDASPVLAFIKGVMESQGGLDLSAFFGLPSRQTGAPGYLGIVYTVAYVSRNRPAAELLLRDAHALRNRSGVPFPGDRISADVLSDIAWPDDLAREVVAVTPPQPATWRTVLPYALELVPNLLSVASMADQEQQVTLVEQALQTLHHHMGETKAGLAMLHTGFGVPVSLSAHGPLHLLERALADTDPRAFHQACARLGLTLEGLRAALAAFHRVRPLSIALQQVLQARTYLSEVEPTLEDPAFSHNCRLILARIDLGSLEADPNAWPSIRHSLLQFKEQYGRAYRDRHRGYHAATARLARQLEAARLLVRALELFNTIVELGEPVAPQLPSQHQSLAEAIVVCSEKPEALPLDDQPFCRACRLRLDQPLPEQEAETLLKALETAWREQNRRLATLAAHQVIAQPRTRSVDWLAKLVQTANLTPLANVLDAEVMAFLRAFAAERPPRGSAR
ncbi:MAG: hypothetical protein EXR47_07230 [Dehalococcoidia bacterium]|nr:hypothetical protein [Dehalococcoidia bacterium]